MNGKPLKTRGSAIILVAGVLAALVLIGSAFLLSAVSEKKVALAHRQAVPMEPVVHSVVDIIRQQLLQDLYIGGNGPYSGNTDWRAYIDYPSPDAAYGDFDRHLASIEVARFGANLDDPAPGKLEAGYWPKLTDLVGLNDPAACRNQKPDWVELHSPGGNNPPGPVYTQDLDGDGTPDTLHLVDTDGDRVNDAFLFPVGTYDEQGEQFYAAVRLIDLSGLVNINTACWFEVPQSTTPHMTQCLVDPSALLWGSLSQPFPLVTVANARWSPPPGPASGSEYFTSIVRLIGNLPVGTIFRPFDWSDELALRWPFGRQHMRSGRLFRQVVLDPNDPTAWIDTATPVVDPNNGFARSLTTLSAGRILARPNDEPMLPRWAGYPAKISLELPVGNPAERQAAFETYALGFNYMLSKTSLTPDERYRMAAQLAVNVIDFCDGDTNPTIATDADIEGALNIQTGVSAGVAGVEPQPFVVQAWYKVHYTGKDPSDPTSVSVKDKDWVAMVLYNPYDWPFDTAQWRIDTNGSGIDDANNSLNVKNGYDIDASGGRLVIRDVEEVSADTAVMPTVTLKDPDNWDAEDTITIYRPGTDIAGLMPANPIPDGQYVPVAQIRPPDFKEAAPGPGADPNVGNTIICSSYRDDRPGKHRFELGAYKKLEENASGGTWDYDTTTPTGGHPDIGGPIAGNGMDSGDPTDSWFDKLPATPVFVRAYNANEWQIRNIAEVSRLFRIGPRPGGAGEPLDTLLAADLQPTWTGTGPWNWNAALEPHNIAVGRLHCLDFPMNCIPPVYPEVPVSCLVADVFTVNSPLTDGQDNDGDNQPPDPTAWGAAMNRESVVHGRINVNTATWATLCALPLLPPTVAAGDPDNREEAAAELLSYRDRVTPPTGGFDFSYAREMAFSWMTYPALRDDTGFASAGEVAIPLRTLSLPPNLPLMPVPNEYTPGGPAYALGPGGTDDGFAAAARPYNDLSKWDMRYAYVSNVVSVNSDVYCAFIRVQTGPGAHPRVKRHYVAIIDRSNCWQQTDRPVIRMLTEIK